MPRTRLPETIPAPRLVIRRWRLEDADALSRAVAESLDHLRPWMSWTASEPLTADARATLLRGFERDWESGGDVVYGAWLPNTVGGDTVGGEAVGGPTVVGGTGYRRRPERAALEIGYWVHVEHLGHGLATEMASALTDAAFAMEGVDLVEIHHDRANAASAAVPARLGFTFSGEHPDAVEAPAEVGIDCSWLLHRADWIKRQPAGA
jgi:ribosomal-protein-serine acetyltransferase